MGDDAVLVENRGEEAGEGGDGRRMTRWKRRWPGMAGWNGGVEGDVGR